MVIVQNQKCTGGRQIVAANDVESDFATLLRHLQRFAALYTAVYADLCNFRELFDEVKKTMKRSYVKPIDDYSATSTELLRQAQANDQTAWQQLVELYSRRMYRWCRRAGLQPADASNMAQEALQAVARNLGGFHRDRPGDTFRGWLRRITDNKIRDHFRKQGKTPDLAAGGLDSQQVLVYLANDNEHSKILKRQFAFAGCRFCFDRPLESGRKAISRRQ